MDRIKLENLAFYAYHGVHEEEARLGQKFVFEIECGLNLSSASESDDLNDSVSYLNIVKAVEKIVIGKRFNLLERLAGATIEALFNVDPRILEVKVKVFKPSAPLMTSTGLVSVELFRQRQP